MNMNKNWPAICKVPNLWFRMWIATETSSGMLLGAWRAFPELFIEGEQQPFVPLSILKECVINTKAQRWGDILYKFNIPEFHWGGGMCAVAEHVPDEYLKLLKEICVPYDGLYTFMLDDDDRHLVDFKGEACVVVEARCDELGDPDQLNIVPVRFIDFDT